MDNKEHIHTYISEELPFTTVFEF